MRERRENDISIGENRWIPFIDITGRFADAAAIDHLVLRANDLWNALETRCVAGCCGFEAFDFWPEAIQNVRASLNVKGLISELEFIRSEIMAMPEDVLSSDRLNNWFDRAVFLALLDHLISNLQESRPMG
jgi:hypothetical protein